MSNYPPNEVVDILILGECHRNYVRSVLYQ